MAVTLNTIAPEDMKSEYLNSQYEFGIELLGEAAARWWPLIDEFPELEEQIINLAQGASEFYTAQQTEAASSATEMYAAAGG